MIVFKKFSKSFVCNVILGVTLIMFFYNFNYSGLQTSFYVWLQSEKISDVKYLLIWTSKHTEPMKFLSEGTNTFVKRTCSFTNCYVTFNRTLLKDVANFDVILFDGPELTRKYKASYLPQSRSPHQKYVFASIESSANYPICNKMYDGYFNWTLTYKLNSDIFYGYMSIKDKEGKVIGPNEEMHWEKVEAMMPINDTLKAKLSTKKIAAAWFVSNCRALSGRDLVVKNLKTELAKYDMQVDIYGKCGTKKCPKGNMEECLRKLETDYYFYLSFENSFAEDYVTEKLLNALKHYTVPVVYGGSNYTRFMPDGIYLSARQPWVHIRELAKEMVNIINNKEKYYDFFKWHNHYSYHEVRESGDTDSYCKMCALINNKDIFLRTSVYEDFNKWWNPGPVCRNHK